MYGLNLIYNPDHHQVLEHHKELLKKAEQAQLARPFTETRNRSISSFWKWLRHWFPDRRSSKMSQAISQSPSSHT